MKKTVLIIMLMLVSVMAFAGGKGEFIKKLDSDYAKYKEKVINEIELILSGGPSVRPIPIDIEQNYISDVRKVQSSRVYPSWRGPSTFDGEREVFSKKSEEYEQDLRASLSKYAQAISAYNEELYETRGKYENLLEWERDYQSRALLKKNAPARYYDVVDKEEYMSRLIGDRVPYRSELEGRYNQFYYSSSQFIQEALDDKDDEDKTRKVFSCFIAMEAIDQLLYRNRFLDDADLHRRQQRIHNMREYFMFKLEGLTDERLLEIVKDKVKSGEYKIK
jgi:hypothetical protein